MSQFYYTETPEKHWHLTHIFNCIICHFQKQFFFCCDYAACCGARKSGAGSLRWVVASFCSFHVFNSLSRSHPSSQLKWLLKLFAVYVCEFETRLWCQFRSALCQFNTTNSQYGVQMRAYENKKSETVRSSQQTHKHSWAPSLCAIERLTK